MRCSIQTVSAAWGAGGFYTINKQLLLRESRHPGSGMNGALPVCRHEQLHSSAALCLDRSLFVTLVLIHLMMLNSPIDSNSSTALKIIPGILVTTS